MPLPALAALAVVFLFGLTWATEIVTTVLFVTTAFLGWVFYIIWQKKPETLFDGKFQPVQDISYGTFMILCLLGFLFMFLYTAYFIFKHHVLGG